MYNATHLVPNFAQSWFSSVVEFTPICQLGHKQHLGVNHDTSPSFYIIRSSTESKLIRNREIILSMYPFELLHPGPIYYYWGLGQVSYVQPWVVMEVRLCMCFPQPDQLGLQMHISSMLHGISRALSGFMDTSLCWCNEKESHWSWGMQAWELDSWLSEIPDMSEIHLNLSRPIQSSWSHKDGWLPILSLCTAWQWHSEKLEFTPILRQVTELKNHSFEAKSPACDDICSLASCIPVSCYSMGWQKQRLAYSRPRGFIRAFTPKTTAYAID